MEENMSPVVELWEIPQIELYMDQVTTFMDNKLSFYKRDEGEKVLTKTMINNYAKEKLFPAPVKKKYSREHMMLLIIIYHLKSTLSISDIKRVLSPLNEALSEEGGDRLLEKIYTEFTKMQKNIIAGVEKEEEPAIFEETEIKSLLEVLRLSVMAEKAKMEAERLIERDF